MQAGKQVMPVVVAAAFGLGYEYIESLRIPAHLGRPVWPILTFAIVFSTVAALRAESMWIPPLAAFACIWASVMFFVVTKSLAAADLPITLPVAIVCSLPSFVVACAMRARRVGSSDAK